MTDQTSAVASTTNTHTVEAFLFALRDQDFATADALLADDLVYQNVGLPTIRGRARVMKMMRAMEGRMGFDVTFHRNVGEGTTVINERSDAMVFGPLRLQFWVCGVFEVHDGRITLWRDYFDVFDMVKATVRGIVGIAVPSLRPRF
ncbi:limonene-1,2-epoxide hydrolase family protein [Mycolicibacterium sp.]|uniref:limonene-1,2-epoxide hydrolase family protein n=1 Tax=Mycolicibacterium sp. TaxID=2320850 RepID=UPI001A2559E5|nr:limonene-1,2-epoxide hydrolase family protein [Mycolicibacterium sp.]MBJ7339419.1 nuclear transport factor 2 family protein [Mycolicibacterium sp.]